MSDANDWEWVRVLAQGRVYDEERSAANRLAWAAVALAASHGGERSGVPRSRAVADRFALRARLVRSLGAWAADPDVLTADVLAEVLAEGGIPGRYQKLVARAMEPVVPQVRNGALRERAERWLAGVGSGSI
ncbi:hypothetical protein ALI22I_36035 [Saccharothrix sp. ALI-22-I]|uniref:hypothetical protein n=1 Tax=Saccharothrix sp. ALI-22-I TaxID=1933778 RepID=UPI00097C183F|nr:hypothetical protein [Saccharothrix sp. ALI-22-I]ONI83845.1 hypothetical protein ALI22I_36035 [Saccharothrix sp. ALI-22-I]